ncbi:hypothetical protein CPAR01_09733 [Colletotrichum paranaense]|uniref:Uncharacterized protein n=1 Tax=Colletotrichum paranaense TaxID=1914294 RepID=A0ABQ9SIA1_9PEZI|nr:uncharacterized protein CPAR01_09733 [Colletotrichum paranaense]KAK1536191.1 hypothetical protein CPAR01_09733 [Colletotrichum paranaense]
MVGCGHFHASPAFLPLRCRRWRARCISSTACYLASWAEPPHAITNLGWWTKTLSRDGCQAMPSLACSASLRTWHSWLPLFHAALQRASTVLHRDSSTRSL